MNYYKILNDSVFIGVGTDLDMRKYQSKHRIFLACKPEQAQYIQANDELYHAQWMLPEPIGFDKQDFVEVIEISKSEYDILYDAIESGDEIIIEEDKKEEPPIVDENTELTVDFVKERKINEMSAKCSEMIMEGFDVVLSDGKSYHFSLTIQDQLNLITLTTLVSTGEQNIPYHADGELCKFYTPEDIIKISTCAANHKTYQVSYFNSLKIYIESLNDIESISAITYGSEIPENYMSDVLKTLNSESGGFNEQNII